MKVLTRVNNQKVTNSLRTLRNQSVRFKVYVKRENVQEAALVNLDTK
jgi:hypothetical protein